MKELIHKKWLSIPVTVFLVLALTAGAVFASTLVGPVTQTITQDINEPYVPVYGSISAPDLTLSSVEVGSNVSQSFSGAVTVWVGPDGGGKYLHLRLNSTSDLYEWCGVTLRSYADDNPIGMNLLINVTYGEIGGMPRDYGPCSVQLTEPGTYYFTETVGAITGEGSIPGTAEVKVDISLEDDPAEENTEPF